MQSFFPSDYEEFIYKSRYARWKEEEGRREDWPETVNRYLDFMAERFPLGNNLRQHLFQTIGGFKTMPSMRALMTAGRALERDNTAGFNCSFLPVDHPRAFDEAMYILLCGTGVGFSVESAFISQLPTVPEKLSATTWNIMAGDSKEGWADSLRLLISALYEGNLPQLDVSLVRPAGARLKTFGGRASGPAPLVELYNFVVDTFYEARGRQLTSVECHDIMCKIGEIVIVGGVRRSAMISLSDLDDTPMAKAKGKFEVVGVEGKLVRYIDEAGKPRTKYVEDDWVLEEARTTKVIWWFTVAPQRALANNSAVYEETPGRDLFDREWKALVDSKSGERGIFSRAAARTAAAKNGRRDTQYMFGTNPCSEIILRPYQFCNLSECVARAGDTLVELLHKIDVAVILGTFQATLTDFPYLRDIWRENTEEERLLGVSLTGIMDHEVLNGSQGQEKLKEWLTIMREHAVRVNQEWAALFGINQATAITAVKPSGTVSQLVNSASGIHARHAQRYVRTVRADNKDPLTQFLIDHGVPSEPCVMKPQTTTVFSFPIEAPEGCVTRSDMTAIEQLELWLIYQEHWCEHKPSVTISVREEEWAEVGQWVFERFEKISGISFLPLSDHVYQQAPYQDCDLETFEAMQARMPGKIDWTKLAAYEKEDNTVAMQTLACTAAGGCEI